MVIKWKKKTAIEKKKSQTLSDKKKKAKRQATMNRCMQ